MTRVGSTDMRGASFKRRKGCHETQRLRPTTQTHTRHKLAQPDPVTPGCSECPLSFPTLLALLRGRLWCAQERIPREEWAEEWNGPARSQSPPSIEYIQVHRGTGRQSGGKTYGGQAALRLSSPTACPLVYSSSAPTEIHLHLVHAGWGPDTPMGRGCGRICLITTGPTHS